MVKETQALLGLTLLSAVQRAEPPTSRELRQPASQKHGQRVRAEHDNLREFLDSTTAQWVSSAACDRMHL